MQWLKSLFAPRASRAAKPLLPPADVYLSLRSKVLELAKDRSPLAANAGNGAIALLMEDVHAPAVVTLATVCDGTTSLYFSNGGGILGAGEVPAVAAASRRWLEAGLGFLPSLAAAAEPRPPEPGTTQFVAVTRDGLRVATAPEAELGERRNPLWPLFYAGQGVLSEIRVLQERAEHAGGGDG